MYTQYKCIFIQRLFPKNERILPITKKKLIHNDKAKDDLNKNPNIQLPKPSTQKRNQKKPNSSRLCV